MPLKITKADEVMEVKTLVCTLYSQPGLGKTSLAFTASNPILFDFDKGAYRAADRGDTVQVEKWADVASITPADLEGYDTIILDTVGKALDFLAADIIAGNPKLGYAGALNQQGWGQLGVKFRNFLASLQRHGKDIILISHMDEKADGDEIKERLKIPGGSKDLVLTDSDMIGRISIMNRRRMLVFSPTETSYGKDPANLDTLEIPAANTPAFSTFMADVLAKSKTALNALSAAQVERKSEVEWFRQHVPGIMDAEGINNILGRAKRAGKDVALMVVKRAEELGLEFDPQRRAYVYLDEFDPKDDEDDIEALNNQPDLNEADHIAMAGL